MSRLRRLELAYLPIRSSGSHRSTSSLNVSIYHLYTSVPQIKHDIFPYEKYDLRERNEFIGKYNEPNEDFIDEDIH